MHAFGGSFPELMWRDYLLVDGWTYRSDPKRLLFVDHYKVLSHVRGSRVLEEIFFEDPTLCDELLSAYGLTRYLYDHDTLAALVDLLGITFHPLVAEVNRFGRLIVFERQQPNPLRPAKFEVKPIELAPLSARTSWVTIECLDDHEPPRPVANVVLEIVTASAEVRTARSGETGVAFVDGIAPGRVSIRVLGLDGSLWRPLEGAAAQPSSTDERVAWHQVMQGECLSTIAHRYGFKNWQDVWNCRLNEELHKRRRSPHVLCPHDMLAVPVPHLYEIVRDAEQTHRLELRSQPEVPLEIAVEGLPGEPLTGHACVLRFVDRSGKPAEKTVTLDRNGCLKTTVPIHVKEATLELVDFGETLTLALGELNPTSDAATGEADLTGVQQRLFALGYGTTATGRLDERTRLALAHFQKNELGRNDASGEPDAETCAKLEECHGV